ncbi:MAG TPA: deoxyribodipyrimidine photo-lyase [Candidatus Cybelea sp.]|jgi:deoxyribodipyrimidine photo-lyase|nr:deoxyribodipyrimidine photo-lyase [Candidatus Cybelea sp.]
MAERPFLYCFSHDLRLDDHAGLAAAAARGEVLPVVVIDDALERRMRLSPLRAAFFCGAAAALAAELQDRGRTLIVRRGARAKVLPSLAREIGAEGAAWSSSYDAAGIERDRRLQSALEEAGLCALVVHDAPAIAPEESLSAQGARGQGYRAFAAYLDRWSSLGVASYEHPLLLRFAAFKGDSEPLPRPSDFGSAHEAPASGPLRARRRFERFLSERAGEYATAGKVPADDGTSELAAHLSFGTISARSIVRAVRERLGDPFAVAQERLSLKLFARSLARRDFFLQLSWFHPRTDGEALQEKMRGFTPSKAHPALAAWREGRTGHPLVDAGIRQLRETGWMHPLVRAVAASFLCFDLGVDWRLGRDYWDELLIEDDPALATGNWQWIAGVGADMAQFPRIYNPERQRRRYDPAGVYVRRWIPELRHLPAAAWLGRPADSSQLSLSLFDGNSYPAPVVEHESAARAFLERYRAFVSP